MRKTRKAKNSYEQFKTDLLRDPALRSEYEAGLVQLRIAVAAAALRQRNKLTQAELAKKIGTTQAVISRFENGGNVELRTLVKVAEALETTLLCKFVPKHVNKKEPIPATK